MADLLNRIQSFKNFTCVTFYCGWSFEERYPWEICMEKKSGNSKNNNGHYTLCEHNFENCELKIDLSLF